ncbi:MAG: hypothetical protein XD63_0661 [Thermoanaerobacterales bacterium 50_218]|nr:MAG: hypothetical protein XD63_0661 [Thermoanaerobacterales bacterium 50_218]
MANKKGAAREVFWGSCTRGQLLSGVQLQPRDRRLLEALCSCEVLTTQEARRLMYGEEDERGRWYVYRRLKKLERAGLLRRVGQRICVTQRTLDLFGYDATAYHVLDKEKRCVGEIYIAAVQSGWEWLPARQAKKEYNFNRGDAFAGLIRGRGAYLLYVLPRSPRKSYVQRVRSEARRCALLGFDGAVVFCPTPDSMSAFGSEPEFSVRRLMVLPLPFGLEVLGRFREGFDSIYRAALVGCRFLPSNRTFADHVVRQGEKEYYLCELFTNDLNVRCVLAEQSRRIEEVEGRGFIVFCFQSQLRLLDSLSLGCGTQVCVVSEDWGRVDRLSLEELKT